MLYKVNKSLITELDERKWAIQTRCSLIFVCEKKIVDFLTFLEEHRTETFNKNLLERFFGQETDEVLDFMQREGLAEAFRKKTVSPKNIILISNNEIFSEMASFLFNYKVKIINLVDFNHNIEKIKRADLIILFWNPFDLEAYRETNNKVFELNIISKNIFFYNNLIYSTNFTKKEWHTPCPMCMFYCLESRLRGIPERNMINFQTLVDYFYLLNPAFRVEAKLERQDYIFVFSNFLKELKLINNDDILSITSEIDFREMTVQNECAVHWRLCGCYE